MIREFHLSPRGTGGISCDEAGAFVGAVAILARVRRNGEDEWQPRDCDRLSRAISAHYGLPVDMASKRGGLMAIARAFNEGDMARAMIATVQLGIPDPPPPSEAGRSRAQMIKLARDLHWSGMLEWDPDAHPRWPAGSTEGRGGEFAPGGETGASPIAYSDAVDGPGARRQRDRARPGARIELADAGLSDASNDPVTEAAARAGGAAQADPASFDAWEMRTALDGARRNSESDATPKWIIAGAEGEDDRDPRFGPGGNRPPPVELIPERLQQSPAGPVVQFLDNLLDITGPGDAANLEAATLQMRLLLRAIHGVDPRYVYESLSPPGGLTGMSWQGRANVIRGLQADLAAAIYRVRGDIKPLQEVTLEFMQRATNDAYDEAVEKYDTGGLRTRPSRHVAIGNEIDRLVRARLEMFFYNLKISTDPESAVRVNRRAYDSSKSPPSYRVPDARVGNFAFDVSLEAKKPSKDQIRDFFKADFKPVGVVIVRPNQLGNPSSYIIWRPTEPVGKSEFVYHLASRWRMTMHKPYVPGTFSQLYDYLGYMTLSSPTFKDKTGYLPRENIDTAFLSLNEGLLALRKKFGEERYAKLRDLSDRMRALFEADPEDKTGDARAGRRLIHEMEDILESAAKRRGSK